MRSNRRLLAFSLATLLAAATPCALAQAAAHDYNVTAGQLGAALNAVAAQSESQILYAPGLVEGKTSTGLSGNLSVDQALAQLLRGTGLHAEAVNANTYVIRAGAVPAAAAPAASDTPPSPPDPARLQAVQVTGSLIPKAQIETASPTIQLTAQEMERRGFNTVYQALRETPIATGAVQGPQGASTYTTGAQALSLFGLDPGFTLVMVDGHPLPDYPLLYNGASNFADLSSIPMAMVERIDIVPGNQSAVYGSSAIAGVVNIILKKNVQGLNLGLRVGGYTQGGGNSQRLELVGGHSWLDDRAHLTYGFQFSNQEPIWAYDRDLTANTAANPTTSSPVGIRTFMHGAFDATGNMAYIAPPAGACDSVSQLFDGTTYLASDSSGSYCGSNEAGYRTMMNGHRQYAGYASGSLQLNDSAELYGTAQYNVAQYSFAPLGGFIWLPNLAGYGLFVDGNTGALSTAWRQLAPEEQNYEASETRQSVHSYQTVLGVRGYFGNSDWGYDAYVDRAEQIVNNRQLHPLLSKVDGFFESQFLGPQQGVDPVTGYPIYTPDWSTFYQAITPADYRAFSDYTRTRSSTSIQHATLLLTNTNLFSLPAGNASLAAQVRAGHQTWNNPTDPRVVAGAFWGLSGTVGSGTRDSHSAAVELNVPVTSMLTADAAVRYDEYKFAGRNDGKATWRVGMEFRPLDTLLFRGNYATAFRAPDMGRIFLGSSNTFLGVTDYHLCETRQPGVPIANCSYNNVNVGGVHAGNRNLKDITAKSWGGGVVWSPSRAFNMHVDYLHIDIADEITDLNVDTLMRDNARCLSGELDAASPTCIDNLARVTRDGLGNLQNIVFGLINISTEKLETLTAGGSYRLATQGFGTFTFSAQYNNVLTHVQRRYPGDPEVDLLADPTRSTEFKTITNASVNWAIKDWNFTLFGVRYGETPNYVARLAGYGAPNAGDVGAWTLFNASAGWQVSDSARLSLSINNLFDKAPPRDDTWARWPHYNNQNYNIYGRAYYLQLDWALGGR